MYQANTISAWAMAALLTLPLSGCNDPGSGAAGKGQIEIRIQRLVTRQEFEEADAKERVKSRAGPDSAGDVVWMQCQVVRCDPLGNGKSKWVLSATGGENGHGGYWSTNPAMDSEGHIYDIVAIDDEIPALRIALNKPILLDLVVSIVELSGGKIAIKARHDPANAKNAQPMKFPLRATSKRAVPEWGPDYFIYGDARIKFRVVSGNSDGSSVKWTIEDETGKRQVVYSLNDTAQRPSTTQDLRDAMDGTIFLTGTILKPKLTSAGESWDWFVARFVVGCLIVIAVGIFLRIVAAMVRR